MKKTLVFLLLILLTGIDLYAGYLFVGTPHRLIPALCMHIVLTLVFAFTLHAFKQKDSRLDDNFSLVALALVTAIPVYGMAGILLLLLATQWIDFQPVNYFEEDADLPAGHLHHLARGRRLNVIEVKKDELEIDSFKDIFRQRDPYLQENAINKLSKILTKKSVSILKEVVQNSLSDAKILAATALIDMEDRIIRRIEEIRAVLNREPENSEAVLQLARVYDLYCYLGVLDPAVQEHYRFLALEQYETFLNIHPDHFEANLEYGRILLNAGRYGEAIERLQAASRIEPQDANPYIWLAEAYYETGNFPQVSQTCAKLSALHGLPQTFKPVVELWRGSTPVERTPKEVQEKFAV